MRHLSTSEPRTKMMGNGIGPGVAVNPWGSAQRRGRAQARGHTLPT